MNKYIYLLELHSRKQPVNVGIFTSLARAKIFIRTLPKKYAYAVYQLPTNTKLTKGNTLEDIQGVFEHWHYGTIGNINGRKQPKHPFVVWP